MRISLIQGLLKEEKSIVLSEDQQWMHNEQRDMKNIVVILRQDQASVSASVSMKERPILLLM